MKEAEAAFGRRTQQNIRRGKKIRKFEDGIELFVDYFTSDSDESDDTLTTSSASKLNYMPDKMDSGLATESNSGDIKNQGNSKNKTSLSKQSVSAPDSEDAVSFPLTGSKPRVYYQKIYSASTSPSTFAVRQAHLQSKKGSVMQSGTKPKHHSVNRSLVDDFTKFPENVLPHHGEKSLSNSHSDSDKSSQDVVSSSLTGSKHRAYYQKVNSPSSRHLQSKKGSVMQSRTQTKCHSVKKRLADDFTKLPKNVSPYHSKKLLSNSVSNSEKSSQDVTSSPLTRSKHKAYYQKVNSPSTRHLQLKKGSVMQPGTKPKYHSVKKRLADDFTKLPENVSPHHSEKSLNNSHSDSEKSSQDLATSVTRSRHTVYDQQFNTPSTRHNLRKTVGKYPVDNFKECPVTVSTQCQTSNHEQSMLTSNVEKSVQVLSVDVDDCLSDSGHNLNENPVQSSRQLSYNKEKSLDLINAKELKMHRKVKWLSKSNVNSKKSVTVTQSTAVSSKSPVQSPENFQFRKKKNPAVIRSDTEDENFDQNSVKKVHKFKSKIPVKIPASLSKGTNSYHITGNDFNSDKISEIVERTEILGTVVNNEIINSFKKIEQKNMQSSLNKNLKRRKELNASRVSARISAPSNNNNLMIDDKEADEMPNKKQIKTTKRINKKLLNRKKQKRKFCRTRYSAVHPGHLDDASVSELPSQRENLHNFKINDKHASKNSKSHCSKTEHSNISRSLIPRAQSPLAFSKNERIQFRKDGNISVSSAQNCFPLSENAQMKNKVTLCEAEIDKASIRTHEFIRKTENKDLRTVPVVDVSIGEEVPADVIRPFSSLVWDYPQHNDPDFDDYIFAKCFQCSSNLSQSSYSNWGFICIKPHRQKPPDVSPDEDIYFNVIKGKVEVDLHTSKFVLKKGGSFIVPRGNHYSIANVHKSKSILVFNTTTVSVLDSYSEK